MWTNRIRSFLGEKNVWIDRWKSGIWNGKFYCKENVLFIYAEEEVPEFYKSSFNNPFGGHGAAFILSRQPKNGVRPVCVEYLTDTSKKELKFDELIDFLKNGQELHSQFFILKDEKWEYIAS